jgi:two-component system sensor histidine kinase PilS (NtrC family)
MDQSAQLPSAVSQETLWRTLQTFNATRIVIALVLLAYLSISANKNFWISEQFPYREMCGIYLLLAVAFVVISAYYKRRLLLQLTLEITVDIAVISLLYIAAGGDKSGLAILYLFPLAGGAILAPLLLALFFVSVVTITLLAESGYQVLQSMAEESISRTGLYGAAFFASVFAINRLASRLIKQEKLAAQRGQDLQVQQAINQMVLADMGDGILVVGRDGTVFTANPAAERMLGLPVPVDDPQCKLGEILSLMPIADAFNAWSVGVLSHASKDSELATYVVVKPDGAAALHDFSHDWIARRGLTVHLKLRFASVEADGTSMGRTVIFMQDVSEIENQAQQLKLASMGRLTASIAHEVRNPLSAISYAASLMGEETLDPAQRRLVSIVEDNVTRLNQMIEDILKLSRKAQSRDVPLELRPFLADIVDEFEKTHSVQKGLIQVGKIGQYRAWFDPLHLREVIVNLLANAVRYASGRSGSIRLHLVANAGSRLELHVQDDGPVISPDVRAHLFEPFYTTSSKGTGLGLYVARELCLNNGAMLDYEYRMNTSIHGLDEPGGRFVVTLASPERIKEPLLSVP